MRDVVLGISRTRHTPACGKAPGGVLHCRRRRGYCAAAKAEAPGLKGKIFSLGIRGDFEVVNERVGECVKEPCGEGLVRGMVEIRPERLYVIEFEDGGVGEIETRE